MMNRPNNRHAGMTIKRPPRRVCVMEALERRLLLSAVMVSDIDPGSNSSNPTYFASIGNTLYFQSDDGTHGTELWKSDGTAAGTMMVKDIRPGNYGSNPSRLVNVSGTLFFVANNGTNGFELWKSNGTEAGTVMVKDIIPGLGTSGPSSLTDVNGTLFFTARESVDGTELWKSNGTEAGTVMVADINPGSGSSNPFDLTNVNGTLYFRANDGTNGFELWKSNGTEAGTVMVKDINSGSGSSTPSELTNINGTVYFQANDGTTGIELWKSNGTDNGTVRVKDINPGGGNSSPIYLTNVNGTIYFQAYSAPGDLELWKSNGTDAGTSRVKDIRPGSTGSYPKYLTSFDGMLYFVASDDSHYHDLWKSDGTEAGTTMVKDLAPGADPATDNLIVVNGTLFFQAAYVLWRSDGSDAGTVRVDPGSSGSYLSYLTNAGGTLYYNAYDATHGQELWAIRPPTASTENYTVQQGGQVTLAGTASDPDPSETLTYQWDLDGDGIYGETGSAAARGDETGQTPTFNAIGLTPGDHAISLRVTDTAGMSATAAGTVTVKASAVLPTNDGSGDTSQVTVHRADGTELTIDPFATGFKGSVTTTTADLTGDGTPDIIVAADSGGSSHIRIFNGTDGSQISGPLGSFVAFAGAGGSVTDPSSSYWTGAYNGPVQVASGDVNGDGVADIIVAAGQGGSSHVKIFNGADGSLLQSFLAFPATGHTDPSDPAYYTDAFQGGVNIAAGDINNDSKADVIAAAGPGAGPQVKVFSDGDPSSVISSFWAYDPAFAGGVNVTSGDVTKDGRDDILTAPQSGTGPNIKVFNGTDNSVVASFWAYDSGYTGGVSVTGNDYNGDGAFDLITNATGNAILGRKQFTFTDGHTPTATGLFFNI